MKQLFLTLILYAIVSTTYGQTIHYINYHREVIRCEQLIAEKKIAESLHKLDSLFSQFDFVFNREYKLAAELSVYEQDHESAFRFLRLGILGGWTIESISRNKALKHLKKDPRWAVLEIEYDSLHNIHTSKLKLSLRREAQEMYKADQKIAWRVLLRIGKKSRIQYALKKFAPHSEKVLVRLNQLITEKGYPGEKLIGNSWWISVNLSHHNSISTEYTLQDTLYLNLLPELEKAWAKGELHPNEYAIIEDWRNASIHQYSTSLYGFLGKISSDSELIKVNENREKLGLRSTELRNRLLALEKETGLNLHLPKGWQKSEITPKKN